MKTNKSGQIRLSCIMKKWSMGISIKINKYSRMATQFIKELQSLLIE